MEPDLFAHDTEVALAAMAALVNSAGPPDRLTDPAALSSFVTEWGYTGRHDGGAPELHAVRTLRARLARLWELDDEGAADLVNRLLRVGRARPQLVRHDGWDYHLHATDPQAPLAQRIAVESAMAMVDVIRQGQLDRLGRCAAPGCGDALVDLSRNRSRRFCDTTCANRTNVAAFRARRRARTGAVAVTPPGVADGPAGT
jgi:predicted RNA-binding Zn ribbon-like protein